MTAIENCSLTDNMANDLAKQKPTEKHATKLKRELAQAWKDIETLPIAEIGARNAGVLEYMRHWEGRAECAEAQLAIAQAELSIKVETIGKLANELAAAQAQISALSAALRTILTAVESGQDIREDMDIIARASFALSGVEGGGNLPPPFDLAAAQAQLVKMREALEEAEDYLRYSANSPVMADHCHEALAQPSDTTALREMLKQERERCAKVSDRHSTCLNDTPNVIATTIRAMEDK